MLKPLRAAVLEPDARRRWGWLCAVLCLAVAAAALAPGDVAPVMTASDKLDHWLSFAALSATGLLALAPGPRSALRVSAGMLAYGGLIELLQTQIPGRVGDWHDLEADALGIAAGVALIAGLRWLLRERSV